MWQRIVLYCIARLSLVLSVFRLFFLVFVCRSHEYHIVRCYILLRPYDFCYGAWQHDSSDSVVRGSEQIKRQREKTRQFEHSGWCMGFLKIESKSKSRTKRYEQKKNILCWLLLPLRIRTIHNAYTYRCVYDFMSVILDAQCSVRVNFGVILMRTGHETNRYNDYSCLRIQQSFACALFINFNIFFPLIFVRYSGIFNKCSSSYRGHV